MEKSRNLLLRRPHRILLDIGAQFDIAALVGVENDLVIGILDSLARLDFNHIE